MDPFTKASPHYRAAMATDAGRTDPLQVYSSGRLLSVFGQGVLAMVAIGLVVAFIVVVA